MLSCNNVRGVKAQSKRKGTHPTEELVSTHARVQRQLPPKGFRLVFVGKKSDAAQSFTDELCRRIERKQVSISTERVKPSDRNGAETQDEGDRLMRSTTSKVQSAYIIALDERGTQLSSEAFTNSLANAADNGYSTAALVLGGAHGLDERLVLDNAHLVLSLSSMRMSHEVARVVLLEQLQRSIAVARNESYHG